MVEIPKSYPTPPPSAIASFDFTDIADGTGVIIFYGVVAISSTSTEYELITNQEVWSALVETGRSTDGTTTINFNAKNFNIPREVKGTVSASMVLGLLAGATGKLSVEIFHVASDDTATSIGSEITSQTKNTNDNHMIYINIPLTQKHFKKGEHIRVTVKLIQVGASGNSAVGHDPQNQDGTVIKPASENGTNVMRFLIPFIIPEL